MALTRINNQALTNVTRDGLPSITDSDMPSGSVLQVKQTAYHTVTSISNGSAANITTQAITPTSSSSKFLLFASTTVGRISGTPNVRGWFRRDGTDLGTFTDSNRKGAISGVEIQADAEDHYAMSYAWLDSPNTTNSITYAVRVGTEDGNIVVNRVGSGTDATWATRAYTMLTVMEIAG